MQNIHRNKLFLATGCTDCGLYGIDNIYTLKKKQAIEVSFQTPVEA
jgi:hypothetical protein